MHLETNIYSYIYFYRITVHEILYMRLYMLVHKYVFILASGDKRNRPYTPIDLNYFLAYINHIILQQLGVMRLCWSNDSQIKCKYQCLFLLLLIDVNVSPISIFSTLKVDALSLCVLLYKFVSFFPYNLI